MARSCRFHVRDADSAFAALQSAYSRTLRLTAPCRRIVPDTERLKHRKTTLVYIRCYLIRNEATSSLEGCGGATVRICSEMRCARSHTCAIDRRIATARNPLLPIVVFVTSSGDIMRRVCCHRKADRCTRSHATHRHSGAYW
jgi:hypothetical protein